MRINIILLVGTLRIISKRKIILQFFVRLFVYSHKNNFKTFWYYSHNILIRLLRSNRSSRPRNGSVKKVFLEICQNLQENKCARVSFFDKVAGLSHFFVVAQRHHKEVWKACNFIKKETFAQELSYEFWTPFTI